MSTSLLVVKKLHGMPLIQMMSYTFLCCYFSKKPYCEEASPYVGGQEGVKCSQFPGFTLLQVHFVRSFLLYSWNIIHYSPYGFKSPFLFCTHGLWKSLK